MVQCKSKNKNDNQDPTGNINDTIAKYDPVEKNNPNAHSEFLVNVYLKHCKHAFDKIDVNQAIKPKEDDFFSLPAEG